jgi:hypothetical protein
MTISSSDSPAECAIIHDGTSSPASDAGLQQFLHAGGSLIRFTAAVRPD